MFIAFMCILALLCVCALMALATDNEGFAGALAAILIVCIMGITVSAHEEIIIATLLNNQDVTIDYRIPNTHTTRKYYLGITQVEEQQCVKVEK